MSMYDAIAVAEGLRAALAAEVERARDERGRLRRLDVTGLLARASERGASVAEARRLGGELARHLAQVGRELGLADVTLHGLRATARADALRLAAAIAEVRVLAGTLSDLDRLNLALAGRALACIRGYVDAIAPTPRAYDRRGTRAAAGAPASATVSSKG